MSVDLRRGFRSPIIATFRRNFRARFVDSSLISTLFPLDGIFKCWNVDTTLDLTHTHPLSLPVQTPYSYLSSRDHVTTCTAVTCCSAVTWPLQCIPVTWPHIVLQYTVRSNNILVCDSAPPQCSRNILWICGERSRSEYLVLTVLDLEVGTTIRSFRITQ